MFSYSVLFNSFFVLYNSETNCLCHYFVETGEEIINKVLKKTLKLRNAVVFHIQG